MFAKINQFFAQFNEPTPLPDALSLEVACAVLLYEVIRADHHIDDAEKNTLHHLLKSHFALTDQKVEEIFNQAVQTSENSNDLYRYTSMINQQYQIEDKIKLVTMLWQLAQADGELAPIEQHIIRKIADLLHLRHSEYIQAKQTAL